MFLVDVFSAVAGLIPALAGYVYTVAVDLEPLFALYGGYRLARYLYAAYVK